MLVLITYDVNTETAAGKEKTAASGKTMRELRKTSAEFCFRMYCG